MEQNAAKVEPFALAVDLFVGRNVSKVALVSAKDRQTNAFEFLFITFFLEELTGTGVQIKIFPFGIRDKENFPL